MLAPPTGEGIHLRIQNPAKKSKGKDSKSFLEFVRCAVDVIFFRWRQKLTLSTPSRAFEGCGAAKLVYLKEFDQRIPHT
jgi:hypothetical protein